MGRRKGGSLRKNTHQLLLGHAGLIQMAASTVAVKERHSSLGEIVAVNKTRGCGGVLNMIITACITLHCSLLRVYDLTILHMHVFQDGLMLLACTVVCQFVKPSKRGTKAHQRFVILEYHGCSRPRTLEYSPGLQGLASSKRL